ncbi:MAG: hypothetical protein HC786_26225 [Richelia sp. CSU_2_1]|nr:hypothetical protein [Microcoleus sp. SM1_3_4]NJR25395.1 hypothetical protein [Richelia sp. CSU_2_1]
MVLSVYDNIEIPDSGTDLLGLRFGIFAKAANFVPRAIVGSALTVVLGIVNLKTGWQAIDPDKSDLRFEM